jgi:hypothetical protein
VANWTNESESSTPPGRTPGKYIVWILGAILLVFLGVSIFLAMTLQPAADHFHNPAAPSKKG